MKKLLEDIFRDLKNIYSDFKIIGKDAILSFDENRYAKIRFTKYASPSGAANSNVFNGVVIDVMDRTKGNLDSQTIAFADVFDSILDLNHPNKIGKHIWNDGRKFDWYGKPTSKDLNNLYNSVVDYLEFTQGPKEHSKMIAEVDKDNNDIKVVIEGGMISSILSNSNKNWDVEIIDFDGAYEDRSRKDLQAYIDTLKFSGEYKEQLYSSHDLSEKSRVNNSFEEKIHTATIKSQSANDKKERNTPNRTEKSK